jgi:hypothetical protein
LGNGGRGWNETIIVSDNLGGVRVWRSA